MGKWLTNWSQLLFDIKTRNVIYVIYFHINWKSQPSTSCVKTRLFSHGCYENLHHRLQRSLYLLQRIHLVIIWPDPESRGLTVLLFYPILAVEVQCQGYPWAWTTITLKAILMPYLRTRWENDWNVSTMGLIEEQQTQGKITTNCYISNFINIKYPECTIN